MQPFREIFWNVPVHDWLYLILIPVIVIFLWGISRRIWPCFVPARGKVEPLQLRQQLKNLWREGILQRRLRREGLAGIMHLLIFWGMAGLFLATILVGSQEYLGLQTLKGNFYLIVLALGADLAGVAALTGVILAVWRRWIHPQKRLIQEKNGAAFALLLSLLLAVLVSGFLVEGLRIAATRDPWGAWSPLGWVFALPFRDQVEGDLLRAHHFVWWLHAGLSYLLIVYLPFSPLAHAVLAFFSIARRQPLSAGSLPVPQGPWDGAFAVSGAPRHLSCKEALDTSACVECGRCQEVCPAYAVGRPLSPRKFLLSIRRGLLDRTALDLDPDVIWSCTTCGACTETCPLLIEQVSLMIDYRRFLVEQGDVPVPMLQALESLSLWGNPWNLPPAQRWTWAENLGAPLAVEGDNNIEVLYYAGCTACYDPVARNAAKGFLELLNRTKVNYRALGSREWCCGDPARRLGEEDLFRKIAAKNVEVFSQLNPQILVTACPHCAHVFKEEYPDFPAGIRVLHYTAFLADLLQEKRLTPDHELGLPVTFHDPCYLGRYGGEFEAPRRLLEACPGVTLREMEKNRAGSFCCGGGGGQSWLDVRGADRMNNVRVSEAGQTGAEKLITACPYCQIMLHSAAVASAAGPKVMVQDIAEFILERISG